MLAAAVVLFPLLGAIIAGLFGRWIGDRGAQLVTCGGLILSALCSWVVLPGALAGEPYKIELFRWIHAGTFEADWVLRVDVLSAVMMFTVSTVSAIIHVYSIGYMAHDPGVPRFMSYLSLFTFFMLALVTADNFLQLYFGWEGVGLVSYILIGFWYTRPSACAAAIKAFLVNRVGDFGFALGIAAIYLVFDSVEFDVVFSRAAEFVDTELLVFGASFDTLTVICLLLFVGAMGKSAQLPLHTWLPDAMEGPTPVSALIHAATMVTAGVYLIARTFPLFELAPTAADIAAFVGLATLLVAATIALVVTDLKRIIAYSTMSQIGYMVVGVSIGAYVGGLFHLMTHAFFKALLFMAAGSVIAAMANVQNIDRMSGFRRAMPLTSVLLIVGALALAAFPGTSGFFSKDEILAFASDRGGMYLIFTIGGYIGAFMTAIYAFRIGFRVVSGEPCEEARELERGHLHHAEPRNPATGEVEDTDVGFPGPEHQIAERRRPMAIAMAVLGVGALFGGLIQIPGVDAV